MSAWQPISSAPKDRRVMLWEDSSLPHECFGQWSEESGAWFSDDGDYLAPTYWQPLPTPPEPRDV